MLFTRFHRVDIDVEELEVIRTLPLSDSSELLAAAARRRGPDRPGQGVARDHRRRPHRARRHQGHDGRRARHPDGVRAASPTARATSHGARPTSRRGCRSNDWRVARRDARQHELRSGSRSRRVRAARTSHGSSRSRSSPMSSTAAPERRSPGHDRSWRGFRPGLWQKEIDVRDFIQQNYEPYEGDASFLAPATARTLRHLGAAQRAVRRGAAQGRARRLPDPQLHHRARPGYIDRDNEVIVGLQTEAPLKRAIMPNGGFRMVLGALKTYGYEPDPHVVEAFTKYRKTHNDGRLRRLHRRHPALPQLPHPDRAARRLRPRPHHRRLPPGGALRRRPAHRAQAAGEGRARRRHVDRRRDHPRPRGAGRADPCAQGAAADGDGLRLRHLRPGGQRAGSRAVAVLRLPGRR